LTLNDLHTGDSAVITRITGKGPFRKRITEMGFIKGQKVTVVRAAPLKDPVEFRIMSGNVSLRRSEASLIEVEREIETGRRFHGHWNGHSFRHRNGFNHPPPFEQKTIRIAFVGNPNCGKTTLYNRICRSHEHVGNYSGVTVSSKEAVMRFGSYRMVFTDLPGTYSLSACSEEELIVRKHINEQRPDVVVNVIDANNIERHMYMTAQLIDMGIQVVIALNMYDDLKEKGDALDIDMLSQLMGIPIVPTIGRYGKGINRLLRRIIKVYEDQEPVIRHTHVGYGIEIERSIERIETLLETHKEQFEEFHLRHIAIKLLEKDTYCRERIDVLEEADVIMQTVTQEIHRLEQLYADDIETLISDARYGFIAGALKETFKKGKSDPGLSRTQKIDQILTHKYLGFPIFLLFLYVMFQATFSLGQYPMEWITAGVEMIGSGLTKILPEGTFRDLMIDGIVGGVGGVIVFLPNILILFFFISLMEDTGYMARTAFIMDRVMHLFGLHGKSFIPLIMGFGCNVPAIMATRTLENRKDRIMTMLIIPFMSCSARLPVYVLIAGAVFPSQAGNVIFLLYLIGVLVSFLTALLLKSTIFRKSQAPFVMELPLYRRPGARMILKHMWFKGEQYLKKMGGVILVASVAIWALGYFPRNVDYSEDYEKKIAALQADASSLSEEETAMMHSLIAAQKSEHQEQSLIGKIGKGIEPVIRPLGFDWKMGVSLLTGFAAKEVVISTMGVLYHAPSEDGLTVSLQERLRGQVHDEGALKGQPVFTPLVGWSFLVFVLFYLPCVAVITAIGRESGSWKWSVFVIFYTTLLAWLASFCVYQIGSLF
jgi:ferrous iron transport protein B